LVTSRWRQHVSERAKARGIGELGSLGSGNHFIELQIVDRIFDRQVAQRFGLREGQVTAMIHTGSRGLGHQICGDHVREMLKALQSYHIELPDPQLAAAPVRSTHGERYLSAMAWGVGAANSPRSCPGGHADPLEIGRGDSGGGPGSDPHGRLPAWLVTDARA